MHTTKYTLAFVITLCMFVSVTAANAVEHKNYLSLGYKAYHDGNFQKAAEYLESAQENDFIVSDYAAYYLGETYLSLHRFDEALNAFNACINYYIKSPLAPLAMEKMGDVYLAKGDVVNSILTYKSFLAEYPNTAQTAGVLYKLVSMLLSNNRQDEAVPFMKRLLIEFPQQEYSDFSNPQILTDEIKKLNIDEFYTRINALFKSKDYKRAASEIEGYLFEDSPWMHKAYASKRNAQLRLLLGQAFYRIRDYKRAKEVFKKTSSNTEDSAMEQESFIWLARTYMRLKDFKTAKDILKTFTTVFTPLEQNASPFRAGSLTGFTDKNLREEALYWLAIIAKEEGDINLTATLLRQLLAEKSSSYYRTDALWQISWIYYMQGNLQKSLEILKQLENSPLRMRALYWQGKISLILGKKDNALRLFKTAAGSFPPDYYSTISKKAAKKLGSKTHIMPASLYINKKQTEPNKTIDSLFIKRAQRLLELGLNNLAVKELASIDQRQDPITISLLYKQAGDFYHSYVLARNQTFSSSNFKYQLAFPKGYKELVEMRAAELQLDPLLIYAVMMQESEFNEKTVSTAGAVGLLQIMPNTGEMIAMKLSRHSFTGDNLFEPYTNISFGTWYLKTLITRFNGNLPLAIAAYNAGPNAVDEWLKRWGEFDMDEFVENIPYPETRKYVEKVLGYYETYKIIYTYR